MSKKETFKNRVIYGTAFDVPLGVLIDKSLPEGSDPVDFSNPHLEKRERVGHDFREVEVDLNIINSKGVTANFLYKNSSFVDMDNVAGSPTLVFYPDVTSRADGVGFVFYDLYCAERTLIHMLDIVRYMRSKENEQPKTNN